MNLHEHVGAEAAGFDRHAVGSQPGGEVRDERLGLLGRRRVERLLRYRPAQVRALLAAASPPGATPGPTSGSATAEAKPRPL